MAYLGTPIDTRNTFQALQGKRFDGDGSTTAFTLDIAPSSTLDIEVFVENVRQDPNSAYTLSGTTLTFTGAPPSGTNNIYVVHQAKAVGTIEVPATYKSDAQTISGARTFNGGITMGGTTPTLTIGDAGAEDTKIVFDGNAQDYHIGLDDSADDLVIGLGSSLGTTSHIVIDEAGHVTMPLQSAFNATSATQSNVTGDETQYQVTFGTETIDRNGDFNTNGTFTAPVTGLYLLSANVGGSGFSSHTRMLNFIVTSNRTYIATSENLANTKIGTSFGFNVSCLADMDANDTAIVQVRIDGGSKVIDIDDTCRFSGCLIA